MREFTCSVLLFLTLALAPAYPYPFHLFQEEPLHLVSEYDDGLDIRNAKEVELWTGSSDISAVIGPPQKKVLDKKKSPFDPKNPLNTRQSPPVKLDGSNVNNANSLGQGIKNSGLTNPRAPGQEAGSRVPTSGTSQPGSNSGGRPSSGNSGGDNGNNKKPGNNKNKNNNRNKNKGKDKEEGSSEESNEDSDSQESGESSSCAFNSLCTAEEFAGPNASPGSEESVEEVEETNPQEEQQYTVISPSAQYQRPQSNPTQYQQPQSAPSQYQQPQAAPTKYQSAQIPVKNSPDSVEEKGDDGEEDDAEDEEEEDEEEEEEDEEEEEEE